MDKTKLDSLLEETALKISLAQAATDRAVSLAAALEALVQKVRLGACK